MKYIMIMESIKTISSNENEMIGSCSFAVKKSIKFKTKENLMNNPQEILKNDLKECNKINFMNDQKIKKIMSKWNVEILEQIFKTKKNDFLYYRCVLFQKKEPTKRFELVRSLQKQSKIHNIPKLLCFYYLHIDDYIQLEVWIKLIKSISKQEIDDYFEEVNFDESNTVKLFLGICYFFGFGYEKDVKKAFEIFFQLSELNDDKAQFYVSHCFRLGIGVEKDDIKSIEYLRKSSDKGNINAMRSLGSRYQDGIIVSRNLKKAIEYFEICSEKGDSTAKCCLAGIYLMNKTDYGLAVKLALESSEQGSIHGYGILAFCYSRGCGVHKNTKKAFELHCISADQGDCYSQKTIGFYYENGIGVEKDLKKSFEYYLLSAKQGHSSAQLSVGDCYFNGKGVKKDLKKAMDHYKLTNDPKAILKIARCYHYGTGVEKNHFLALEYYLSEIKRGNLYAVRELKELLSALEKQTTFQVIKKHKQIWEYLPKDDVEFIWMKMEYHQIIREIVLFDVDFSFE